MRYLLNRLYVRLDRPGCTATWEAPSGREGGTCGYRRHRFGEHSFQRYARIGSW